MTMFHVDERGDVKPCRAQLAPCPYVQHGGSVAEAQAQFEQSMIDVNLIAHTRSTVPSPLTHPFAADSHYGMQSPRSVQINALNETAQALDEDGVTQLVAACGTGKTYMARQLLQREMMKTEANGVGVILTSSIKLATDTAQDLRPTGGYDQTFGIYGDDYEVIEVHSGVRRSEDVAQTVLEDGVISVNRIQLQMEQARRAGKRIIIVATYDSCARVQQAQERLGKSYKADLLIHDEAHNVLGQQRPTTVANDDNVLTAYTGFHNTIPGAIQSRRRLYMTASPVMRERPGDAETPTLDEAREIAQTMMEGNQYARVTYYSDDAAVGRVSGFISQQQAIEQNCLAVPRYEIRNSTLRGRLKNFSDVVVNADGTMREREKGEVQAMNARTYGAVLATLDAFVADHAVNPPTNALIYAGSIDQAEAFSANLAQVARAQAGEMDAAAASLLVNDDDYEIRRRARMALLADNVEVRAAHSSSDADSVRERRAAFAMFSGKAVEDDNWTPHRRVLANVDIFSEGVSIPEIDTVVIADDEKCSERSMTQAIGRAIRVIPGTPYKTHGHVIVPNVFDEDGVSATEASTHLAAYGASRVERALTARRLRGERVGPDKTVFTVVEGKNVSQQSARDIARAAVVEPLALMSASETRAAHAYLRRNELAYRNMSSAEQASMVKSRIAEKALDPRWGADRQKQLQTIVVHLQNKTAHEMKEERRNARVVTAALAAGDVSSLNESLAATFIENGVLQTQDTVAEIAREDKIKHVRRHQHMLRYAVFTRPAGMGHIHRELRSRMPETVLKGNFGKASMEIIRGNEVALDRIKPLANAFETLLENPENVDLLYEFAQENDAKRLPLINNDNWKILNLDLAAAEAERTRQQRRAAVEGEQRYAVNETMVRKTGELTAAAVRQLKI